MYGVELIVGADIAGLTSTAMIGWIANLLGLLLGFLLFYRWPTLPDDDAAVDSDKITVIIPARNEAANLPRLLQSLRGQTRLPDEIICVDDGSEDQTSAIAVAFGVRLLTVADKPSDWVGKSWACQLGASQAKGNLLLFLDADVWLGHDALRRLAVAYQQKRAVISVQPYHQVLRLYEYFSLFFNLVLIGANGIGWPFKCRHIGLFGPVILISRDDYQAISGHSAVQASVVDDLALGQMLHSKKLCYNLYTGGRDIAFRMYGGGVRQLFQGWTKNFATGAAQTPLIMLLLIIFWITAGLSIGIDFASAVVYADPRPIIVTLVLYVLYAGQLMILARRVGGFHPIAMLIYPVWLIAFLLIFLYSLYRKAAHRSVTWKDRQVKL